MRFNPSAVPKRKTNRRIQRRLGTRRLLRWGFDLLPRASVSAGKVRLLGRQIGRIPAFFHLHLNRKPGISIAGLGVGRKGSFPLRRFQMADTVNSGAMARNSYERARCVPSATVAPRHGRGHHSSCLWLLRAGEAQADLQAI